MCSTQVLASVRNAGLSGHIDTRAISAARVSFRLSTTTATLRSWLPHLDLLESARGNIRPLVVGFRGKEGRKGRCER